jgi:hypothetical protein
MSRDVELEDAELTLNGTTYSVSVCVTPMDGGYVVEEVYLMGERHDLVCPDDDRFGAFEAAVIAQLDHAIMGKIEYERDWA